MHFDVLRHYAELKQKRNSKPYRVKRCSRNQYSDSKQKPLSQKQYQMELKPSTINFY